MEEIKKEYIRYKEILQKVSDGDDQSMEAILLRHTWDTESLSKMQERVKLMEDQGIRLTFRRID